VEKVKQLIQNVIDEVDNFVRCHGFIPKQVMVTDEDYNILRKQNLTYDGFRLHIVSCGRVVNEEYAKKRHFKRS
jgi:hypothetical protein